MATCGECGDNPIKRRIKRWVVNVLVSAVSIGGALGVVALDDDNDDDDRPGIVEEYDD